MTKALVDVAETLGFEAAEVFAVLFAAASFFVDETGVLGFGFAVAAAV